MLPEAAGRRQLLKPKVHAYNLVPFFSLSLKPLYMCGKGKKLLLTFSTHISCTHYCEVGRDRSQNQITGLVIVPS